MKIGCLGDLHLRATKPMQRIDDYYTTQFEKLEQAFEHFKFAEVDFILQPGDFFNSYGREPYYHLYDVFAFISRYEIPIYIVLGQHDIKFHDLKSNDLPIRILVTTEAVELLSDWPIQKGKTFLYGASWGNKIPEKVQEEGIHVLVMHKMVINGEKLWHEQTDYIQARMLQKKYDFDLFVTGDNHQAFVNDKVINCGSLGRMSIDQEDHKPMYAIWDNGEIKTYEYDIKPFDEVMNTEQHFVEKISQDKKKDYADSLSEEFDGQLSFRENITEVMKQKRRIKPRTKQLVEESLHGKG